MLGEIVEIKNHNLLIKKNNNIKNDIINFYVKIYDDTKTFIGEIISYNATEIEIKLMGELVNNRYFHGINSRPSFNSSVELLSEEELKILFGLDNYQATQKFYLGKSAQYNTLPIFVNINDLFANHLVVLGNTGSGKSCGMARLLQNIFYKKDANPYNSLFFIIDAYGEYQSAFSMINYVHKDLKFKTLVTNASMSEELLKIPLWLLSVDDICLLLEVNQKNQIPIVEKALKIVNVFKKETSSQYKNSIIAKALLDIFISGNAPAQIRDQVFSVLTRYNTPELNLDTKVFLPGYTRPLKQCLRIDDTGKIRDMELVINFLQGYVLEHMELTLPDGSYLYNLNDLLYAFDFALIDEGMLYNDNVFNIANELRVRLASLIDGDSYKYFTSDVYYPKEEYFRSLITKNNERCQVINFNLSELDDRLAKVVAKIYSKFLFDYVKNSKERATLPIHIILEEAHRYVQVDNDVEVIGYNIFERIAKEGRKYGILLNLISQRPSELSPTVISQCNNFLVFKITHPTDIDYLKAMIPYVDEDIVEKIKNLPVGNCLSFGGAFLLPTIIKMDLASPKPSSSSCDVANIWFK